MAVRRRHFDQLATPQSWASPAAVIAHIDLDAFYAQCLCVHYNYDPTEPLGCRQWNSLIAVNYPARAYGIKRGASVDEARKLCPEIHLPHVATFKKGEQDWDFHDEPDANDFKVSLDHFRRESRKIFTVLKQHFVLVEKAGIDEGFVDLGQEVHAEVLRRRPQLLNNTEPDDEIDVDENELIDIGAELVDSVRQQIFRDLHYTCSAGVARNKLLAKLGSGFQKPFKQTVVHTDKIPDFLQHFKITDAWGWGGKQGKLVLADLGVSDDLEDQCGYVRSKFSLSELQQKLKGNTRLARNLFEMVRGEHQSEVTSRTLIKSMVAVKDFRRLKHLETREDVDQWLRVFSADLSGRLADLHEDLGTDIVPKTITVRQDRPLEGSQSKQQPFVLRGTSIEQLREQIFEQSKAISDTFVKLPCTYLVVEVSHFSQLPKERLMFAKAPKPETSTRPEQGPMETRPASNDDDLFVEDLWRCPKCAKEMKSAYQQEHEDWHFAKKLQDASSLVSLSTAAPHASQVRRAAPRVTKDTNKKKSKPVADQKNILDFFKK